MSDDVTKTLSNNDEKIFCPCCGLKTLTAFKEPSQDVVDQYIACILTGEPFSRVYKLYNGRITVLVTSLTDRLTTKALKVVALINNSNIDKTLKQALSYLTYRLLPIVNITVKSDLQKRSYFVQLQIIKAMDTFIDSDNINDAVSVYSDAITTSLLFSNIPANILDKTVGVHAQLVNSLIQLGMTLSFYEGIQQD